MLNYMAYTKDEIKSMILEQLEEELEAQKSALIRRYEKKPKKRVRKIVCDFSGSDSPFCGRLCDREFNKPYRFALLRLCGSCDRKRREKH